MTYWTTETGIQNGHLKGILILNSKYTQYSQLYNNWQFDLTMVTNSTCFFVLFENENLHKQKVTLYAIKKAVQACKI
jgi:hypothetical protein